MNKDIVVLNEKRPEVNLVAYTQDYEGIEGKRPAIIVLAGGSFMYKSEREADPIALKFAAMGYQAFVLNYTTYTEGNQRPDYDGEFIAKPHTQFPTQLKEIADAFHIIHENADKWRVDVDKIGLIGFSAGGFHTALYGTSWNTPLVRELVDYPAEELRPAFIMLAYALTDTLFGYDYEVVKALMSQLDSHTSKYINAILTANFGTSDVSKETIETYSPINNIGEDTPPAFIWSTFEDETVPVQASIDFAKAMVNHKRPVELHIFEKGGHGLATANDTTARSENERGLSASEWLPLAEKWLAVHASIKNFE